MALKLKIPNCPLKGFWRSGGERARTAKMTAQMTAQMTACQRTTESQKKREKKTKLSKMTKSEKKDSICRSKKRWRARASQDRTPVLF